MLLGDAHCLKCRDYPLMLSHNLLSISLFSHPVYVSFHHSLDLLPLKPYLIWCFDHLRATEIHPFLNFMPLSLSKVEHCHEELWYLSLCPFLLEARFSCLVQHIDLSEYLVEYVVHLLEHFEPGSILSLLVLHDHLFLLLGNFVLDLEFFTQELSLFLHVDLGPWRHIGSLAHVAVELDQSLGSGFFLYELSTLVHEVSLLNRK